MSTPTSGRFTSQHALSHPPLMKWSSLHSSHESTSSIDYTLKRPAHKVRDSHCNDAPMRLGLAVPPEPPAAFPEDEHYDALLEEFASSLHSLSISDELDSRVGSGPSSFYRFGEDSEASTRPCTGHGEMLVNAGRQDALSSMSANRKGRGSIVRGSVIGAANKAGCRGGNKPSVGGGFQATQTSRPTAIESVSVRNATNLATDGLLPTAPEWQAQFYKTKLCPFYVADIASPEVARNYGMNIGCAKGSCLNGENCRFAHSFGELRPLPDLKKTKLCSSYTKKSACRTPGCPFAHSPQELRTSSSVFYKVTLCNFYKNQRCWNGPNCRFAHGTEELRASPISAADDSKSPSFHLAEDTEGERMQSDEGTHSGGGAFGGGGTQREVPKGTDFGSETGRVYDSFLEDIVNRFDESTTRLLLSALTSESSSSEKRGGTDHFAGTQQIFPERKNIERSLMSGTPPTLSFASVQSAETAVSDFLSENDFTGLRSSAQEGRKCGEELLLKCIIDDLACPQEPIRE